MKRRCVCAAWIGLALAGDAAGDESGLYVSAGLGQAEMRDKSGLGQLVVDEDKNDLSWTLGLGYRFNRYIALDLGYVDLGEVEADLVSRGSVEFSGRNSFAAEGATLGLVGMVPIGRWEPYVKAGMLFSKTVSRFDGQFFGDPITQRSDNDAEDPFYGAGLRYGVTEPLRIYLDVTYCDEVGGKTSVSSSYLNASAGVLWQF
jgi:OmpA-OmpF porin, OOP family